MDDLKVPPTSAETQAVSQSPPVARNLQPPSAEADLPPPPVTNSEAHPPPPNSNEAHQLPASVDNQALHPPPLAAQNPIPPPRHATQDPPPPQPAVTKPSPPPTSAAHLPTRPTTATTEPPPRGRKRPLGCNFQIENSKYFKMRLMLRDMRPLFLEVLRTPDFKNCKAARDIQEKMKLMLELYRQMTGETGKRESTAKSQSLSNGNTMNQIPKNAKTSSKASEMHQSEEGDDRRGPVVGGSAFGRNFITYGGSEPVYYGTTKEAYRSSNPITQGT